MKRYLLLTSVLTFGLCLLVALFNYRVDPYAIYHFKGANVDSLSRIDQFFHLRVTKPWMVVQTKPTAIIVGTSRSATVHPQHPGWPKSHSYNLSVPGQTVYEMLRFIEHAQANGPLDKLMLGLDFEAFIHPEPQFKSGFEEARLARDAGDLSSPRFIWQRLSDVRDTLLSVPGFSRSLAALTGTATVGRRYYRDGTWVSTNSTFTGRGGYIYVGRTNIFELHNERLDLDKNLQTFAAILRFAHQQKIETRLFITPEHVFMIDLWWRLGYGELWNEFHRRLIEVNNQVAMELGVKPFPLFGFNHLQGVVNEPVAVSQNSGKSFFTDGIHFRPDLGKQIMAGVWTDGDAHGARLDLDSVEPYLTEVGQLRVDFESANSKLTANLRREISPELE
jgi:hypothetical protein